MINGEVQAFPLADLFQWLAFTKRTGKLLLAHGNEKAQFHFAGGELAAAFTETIHRNNPENARRIFTSALAGRSGYFVFKDCELAAATLGGSLGLPVERLLTEASQHSHHPESNGSKHTDSDANGATFSTADALRLEIVGQLLKGDFSVPAMPHLAARVLELTNDPNCSVRELGELVSTDQSVAAQMLRYANSTLLGSERHVDTLPEAVMRLGSQEVVNIVLAATLRNVPGRDAFAAQRRALWVRSSTAAFLARAIARQLQLDQNLAFVCGLLMDYGTNVLYTVIQQVMGRVKTSMETINAIVDDYHPRVGRLVGEKWSLPNAIVQSMGYHHCADQAADEPRFVALSALSDFLTVFATGQPRGFLEKSIEDFPPERLTAHPSAATLQMSADQATAILQGLPKVVDDSLAFMDL